MKVRVIKGTNQIGGCITEVKSDNAKIVIDFGEDLPSQEKEVVIEKPMIEGLTTGKASYDAVFITHSHGDHIGLINYILDDIPVYVEEKSQKIYELLCDFTRKEAKVNTKRISFEEPVTIKDIKVTSYIADHSSYNSAMLLIESNNRRILHTGDFRNHGRKGKILESTLKKIGPVDLLVTEGTSFGRDEIEYDTEEKITEQAIEVFKKYNQIFLLQSSTNIDRIVSFYKASKKTNKTFIEDLFAATITSYLKESIPNPITFKDVYVWTPLKYRRKNEDFKNKYLKPLEKFSNSKVVFQDYSMMVKTSMLNDIKMLKEKGAIVNACLVYSMWEGYQEEESFRTFIDNVKLLGIDFKIIHTSGHADIKAIKELAKITQPKKVVTIHTLNKEKSKEIFKNAVSLEDNEEIEV